MNRFDILVIGAGMGGMCTAAQLAVNGYHVLVVESLPRIGGRCSTIDHKGYKLTTGVLGVEMSGGVESFFHSIGVPFDIRPAGDFHYLINGRIIKVPSGKGLRYLLEAAGADESEIELLMGAISRALNWKIPSPPVSFQEWLSQYTQDPKIQAIFQTIVATQLFVGLGGITAESFFRYIRSNQGIKPFGYAPAGNIALPLELERIILENGGEVWTRARAERILMENKSVKGALINHNGRVDTITASAVVSNIGPLNTAKLAGRENLDHDHLKQLDTLLIPAQAICLQIALKCRLFTPSHLLVAGSRRINSLHQPTAMCPDLAPQGHHLLVATAITGSSSELMDLEQEIDLCMQDLKELFPGFQDKTEILITGVHRDRYPVLHTVPGRDVSIRTPVINLYNVGDGVKEAGYCGLPATVESANRVAADIHKRINLWRSDEATAYQTF
ncbi:MAG: NAD(P)/FAD-dependent oxidoreductase [Proteobacteria bacterium]|nr:NAD(P)/FAD-dependent oxidoreductase [Pseudomonadota bacterium]